MRFITGKPTSVPPLSKFFDQRGHSGVTRVKTRLRIAFPSCRRRHGRGLDIEDRMCKCVSMGHEYSLFVFNKSGRIDD